MKLTVSTQELKTALARLSNIPGASGATIHTQIVTMSADLAGLTLTRFTSEAKIAVTIDEDLTINDDSGSPRVAHGPLLRLISECPTKEVQLTYTAGKPLEIVSGKVQSRLKTLDEDILAEPPEDELEMEQATVLLEDLTELLGFTAPAASKDSAGSYVFCGVALRMVEGKLQFIATDRNRCHIAIAPFALNVDCVIPSEGIDAIFKAVGTLTGPCTFAVGETSAKVICDRLEISVTLLAEKYPATVQKAFQQFESSIESKVAVNRDEFVDALKICGAVADDDRHSVTLDIQPKVIIVTGDNQRDSATKISVDCKASKANTFNISGKNVASVLAKLELPADGSLEIRQSLGALFAMTENRRVFFTIAKPQP